MGKIDTDQLIQHLQEKWQDRPCPMCNARKWNIQSKAFELREYYGGDLVIGRGPIIPVIPIICTNCGNTVLVNSLVAGVDIQKNEKSDEGGKNA